jgi:hypothetical protein
LSGGNGCLGHIQTFLARDPVCCVTTRWQWGANWENEPVGLNYKRGDVGTQLTQHTP